MAKLAFRPTKVLLVFWIIGIVVGCIPVGGIVTAACLETALPWHTAFAMGFLIPLAFFGIYAVLFFHTIRYELDDRYVMKASGVLWKQRRSIPLEKITNIDVRQGPFERLFGYGKIWIFTPSTGSMIPEAKLVGVPRAHEVKQTIIERSEATKQPQPIAPSRGPGEGTGEIASLLREIRDSLRKIESSLSRSGEPR